MSQETICDGCGEPIGDRGDPYLYMHVGTVGSVSRRAFELPREIHFHASPERDCFRKSIEELRGTAPNRHAAARDQLTANYVERRRKRQNWIDTPEHERQRVILGALGDDELTLRELNDRIADRHPDLDVGDANLQALLARRMLVANEVHRVKVSRANRQVWGYSRNRDLSGPIADLQKQLEES